MKQIKRLKISAIIIEAVAIVILGIFVVRAMTSIYSFDVNGFRAPTFNEEGKYTITSEAFNIPKGDGRIVINYSSDKPLKAYLEAEVWNQTYLPEDEFNLSPRLNEVTYDYIVRHGIDDVKLVLESEEPVNIVIEGAHFTDNNYEIRRCIVYFILITIICFILFIKAESIYSKRSNILLGIVVVFLASLPLFVQGLEGHFGQDIEFHLLRIDNIANDLREFNIPSRIGTVWLDGYGYPSSLYYGDIILYPAAVLRLMGFPVIWAFKLFMIGINALTAFLGYITFKTIFDNSKIALLCSFAYVASTYRMFDIFIRGAIGESMALVFLPVVLLGVYLVYTDKKGKGILYNSTIFALGMTGLVCTHVMSTEMTAVALVIFGLINFKKTFTKRVILSYIITVVETIVLSLYFIVPFADVNLHQMVTINYLAEGTRVIQHEGMDIAQFFSFFQNVFRELDYKSFTGKAVAPSILLMTVLVIAIIMWIRGKAKRELKIASVMSLICIVLSTNIFPWDLLSKTWIGNMLAQVQFPWRYLGLGTLFMSLLLGYVITQIDTKAYKSRLKLAFLILGIVGVSLFTSNYIDDAKLVNYMDTASMDADNVGIYEYILGGTDWNNLDGNVITNNIGSLDIQRHGSSIHMDVVTESDASIVLPVQNYYGYLAKDSDGNVLTISNADNNNMRLELPGNWTGSVDISVGYWHWTLALIISLIGFVAVILYFVIRANKREKDE